MIKAYKQCNQFTKRIYMFDEDEDGRIFINFPNEPIAWQEREDAFCKLWEAINELNRLDATIKVEEMS